MKRLILLIGLLLAAPAWAATPFPEAVSTSTTTLTLQPTVGVYTFTGSSPATWTLPAVAGNKDRQLTIKNRGSATITVQRAGSDNLYTTTTATSTTVAAGDWIKLINDGTYWLVAAPGAGGGSGAPTTATYITQTADGTLSAEQALGSLATGLVKNTTTTGVLSIASSGTDYVAPGATASGNITTAGNLAVTAGSDRQFIVDRTLTSDYARFMFKSGGTEMWGLGLRGDNGGSGVNNTLSLTGNSADSYPNIFNVVPGGANYAVKWFNVAGAPSVWWDANGQFVANEQGNAQNFRVESDTNANMLYVDGTNNRVGIGLNNPSTALEVSGTATATAFAGSGASLTSLNASNLSSGTVAAARGGAGTVSGLMYANGSGSVSAATISTGLTDTSGTLTAQRIFVRDLSSGPNTHNPVDATTYYWGATVVNSTWGTNPGKRRIIIPSACTIKKAYVYCYQTAGSNEQSTISIRVNNTTDTTIVSTLTNDAAETSASNTSLNIALNAGDYIEIKWVTPTWVATNPTGVAMSCVLEFQQ